MTEKLSSIIQDTFHEHELIKKATAQLKGKDLEEFDQNLTEILSEIDNLEVFLNDKGVKIE